ncbi:MAG: ComF family protein [Chitinophagaceae bacterium]|nr:ComF family protein [Chitinophagaceae bacterium]
MQTLKKIISSTLHLFYPHLCNGCNTDVLSNNSLLCLECINNLPHTQYAKFENNPIEKIFWGRIPLQAAFAEFYFDKESLIQHLIHQLKYKNNTAIGVYLGEMMGKSIIASDRIKDVDALIPLPLFPDKERKRGYNQAKIICDGISNVTNIPVLDNIVIRQRFTETQTRKHRTERWQNVAESFAVADIKKLESKHLLLVDDVITTGATLEACGNIILQIPGTKLSIATLALASK